MNWRISRSGNPTFQKQTTSHHSFLFWGLCSVFEVPFVGDDVPDGVLSHVRTKHTRKPCEDKLRRQQGLVDVKDEVINS